MMGAFVLAGTAEAFAYRLCTPSGWLQNTTNYNACIAALGDDEVSDGFRSERSEAVTIGFCAR